MSSQFSNMGLTSSKPFQISLSDIIKKSGVIQPVAVVKSLLKIIANLKSQTIKNVKNTVVQILTLLTELFSMSPNTPNKNSLNFLSDYYFDTKSPVAFTSPLVLY